MTKLMLDAMTYKGNRFISAWLMGRASYQYARYHGLTINEAFAGAVECFLGELTSGCIT